jgi:hypothetical protein
MGYYWQECQAYDGLWTQSYRPWCVQDTPFGNRCAVGRDTSPSSGNHLLFGGATAPAQNDKFHTAARIQPPLEAAAGSNASMHRLCHTRHPHIAPWPRASIKQDQDTGRPPPRLVSVVSVQMRISSRRQRSLWARGSSIPCVQLVATDHRWGRRCGSAAVLEMKQIVHVPASQRAARRQFRKRRDRHHRNLPRFCTAIAIQSRPTLIGSQ